MGQSPNKITRLAGRAAFAEMARAAARSPREDQALLLRRRLPLVPNKASSDAGRRTAKRWPCALVRTKA